LICKHARATLAISSPKSALSNIQRLLQSQLLPATEQLAKGKQPDATTAASLDHKVHLALAARTVSQAHLESLATPATLASPRQSVCHQHHPHASRARQVLPDPLDSQATKAPPGNQVTKAHLAKMLNPELRDHRVHQVLLDNQAQWVHLVMQVNPQKALHLLLEMLDHPAKLAHKGHQALTAVPELMDSPEAQDQKDHLVPPDPMETLAQMDSPVAKDRQANRESLVFAQNIAPWMAECFSKTGSGDKRQTQSNYHSLSQMLPDTFDSRLVVASMLYFIKICCFSTKSNIFTNQPWWSCYLF